MAGKRFRFGVVAAPQGDGTAWTGLARRLEGLGYSALMTPDNLMMPAPAVSLGMAAAVTERLCVGTYVYAAPLRTPRQLAWEARSLTAMTGGRFHLGLGTGLPVMRQQAAQLGLAYGNGNERLAQIGRAIDHVRELDAEAGQHTPVLVAAGGPKARALAVEKADIVAISQFMGPRADARAMARTLREEFGEDALDRLEFAVNIFVVGDRVPGWTAQFLGADAETLQAQDNLSIIRGSVDAMVDEVRRRRDGLGVSFVSVHEGFAEAFAPVVERLSGT